MKYKTKEMTIILRPDNIVENRINDGITQLTEAGIEENFRVFAKIATANDEPKGGLTIMPSFYVNKEILKKYTKAEILVPVAYAIVTTSFSSRLVGNLFLTLRQRFWASKDDYPIKLFYKREDAIKWVRGYIEQAKNA